MEALAWSVPAPRMGMDQNATKNARKNCEHFFIRLELALKYNSFYLCALKRIGRQNDYVDRPGSSDLGCVDH